MLERTEKDIMNNLQSKLKAGDLPKAQMLGKQIAMYRNMSDKNFERAIYLQTEAQVNNYLPRSVLPVTKLTRRKWSS